MNAPQTPPKLKVATCSLAGNLALAEDAAEEVGQLKCGDPDVGHGPAAEVDGDELVADEAGDAAGDALADALRELEDSRFARAAFGDAVVDHLLHFARTELASYEAVVTDFERARYFERI